MPGKASIESISNSRQVPISDVMDILQTLVTEVQALISGAGVSSDQLALHGVVTAVPGANQFTAPTLSLLGAGKFADATAPYSVFVLRDAGGAGAAPQGEMQLITAYVSLTGTFTTNPFTAAIDVGDEVLLLNPRIAEIFTILNNVGYEGATSLADKLTLARAVLLDRLSIIAAGGAGELTPVRAALLDNLDAAVSSRAVPGDLMSLTAATLLAVQALILADATPFNGADIDAAISSRAAPGDAMDLLAATIAAIREITEDGGQILLDGTEQVVYLNDAPAGVYEPLAVAIDLDNITPVDQVTVRTYYRIRPAGNLMQNDVAYFTGDVDPPLRFVELKPNRYGVAVTIERTTGGIRAVDWEVLYKA